MFHVTTSEFQELVFTDLGKGFPKSRISNLGFSKAKTEKLAVYPDGTWELGF
jgi:hypothetical protein